MPLKHMLAVVLAVGVAGAAVAQPNVHVTIGIHQPGLYGQIRIGDLPPPALVAPYPLHARRGRPAGPPIYIYAPDHQRRAWQRYCNRYQACDRPVYFVREDWVRERYEHEHPGWDRGRKHRRNDDREEHGDRRR